MSFEIDVRLEKQALKSEESWNKRIATSSKPMNAAPMALHSTATFLC